MDDDKIKWILFFILLAIIYFIQYKIAVSDINPWIKFWLLK